MVVTRSQCDAAEITEATLREAELQRQRIETERIRRITMDPPASPSTHVEGVTTQLTEPRAGTSGTQRYVERRRGSPAGSAQSQRSTVSVTTRMRLAELEASEKLAAIQRKELELEKELVKKRLEVEVSVIQDEQESLHNEPLDTTDHHARVDEWLRRNPISSKQETVVPREEPRQLRFEAQRRRSTTPTKSKSGIEQLAITLEKMARPRVRSADLPTFSGSIDEWLSFKASYRETTLLYQVSVTENLQRLRNCLRGEARNAVSALLHTASNPETIIKTLEQCFGRPEVIIDKTLQDLRKVVKPGSSAAELNGFAIKIQNIVCIIETLDRKGYLHNPMLAREVLDKLSPHLRARWCDYAHKQEGSAEPDIVLLSRFLMLEADLALRYTYTSQPFITAATREARTAVQPRNKTNRVFNTVSQSKGVDRCPNCSGPHMLTRCPKYEELTVSKRWELLKELKICFKCAQRRHPRHVCTAKPCGVDECRRPHHHTLHYEPSKPEERKEAVLSVESGANTEGRTVLLKMCPVTVVGPRGEQRTYALLDEGATISLINEELAKSIGAEGPAEPLHLRGANMRQTEEASRRVTVHLKGSAGNELHRLRARTMKNLQLHQQAVPEALLKCKHMRDIPREAVCYERARPGILVGTDHWEMIVSRELRVGGRNEPAASRTQLGWVVHGTAPRKTLMKRENVLHIHETDRRQPPIQGLHGLVEAHFAIDALGINAQPKISEDTKRAIAIVEETTKRVDGGYEVGLPWRHDGVVMPDSYNAAMRRLMKIERSMDASDDFCKEYTKQVENLIEKGYAAPCDGSEVRSPVCWYLPHFAVQNLNKPGKYRLVFDAAARSKGVCLNDKLLEGPDLLLPLPGILFRFREHTVAVTADIQEMFLRVKIRKEDQPAQQFLWRGNRRDIPPQRYKMTSMLFGAASSPYMAHHVRNHNADVHAAQYPMAVETIKNGHYMDDLVVSYEDSNEAWRSIEETRTVHEAAGFTLRGWNTNEKTVLRNIPVELHAASPTLRPLGGEQPENKILGLFWNAEQDELGFNTSMNRVPAEVRSIIRPPTKREALSAVMSIYDPLGLLSQYTVRAKIILQNLWRLQIGWDEPIPEEEGRLFSAWLAHLEGVATLRLPRCYKRHGIKEIELHVLCDASEQAYAAVAYWRLRHEDDTADVVLVAAKSKVAPRKTQTIPRLELQAAVIGARLADTIKREHRYEISNTTFWTDSSTVVHWVRHDARRYTPFVAHRLGELAELTHKEDWRWLPTKENVADDATRWSDNTVKSTDRWFQGPRFLHLPREQWPAENTMGEDQEHEVLFVKQKQQDWRWLPDPHKFSKYETLVRTIARVLAFIDIRIKRRTRYLENQHIERAERLLLQRTQQDSFADDIKRLRNNQTISRTSKLYRLDPELGEDGLMRLRGRIGAAAAGPETKKPVILDGGHPTTKLLVLREHCAAGHANRERVTNDIRQRYWVLRLRPTVRGVESRCALCRVRRAKPQVPTMGDLPRARLDPYHRPFTNCGVDYFGPMLIKIGRRREKRWGALFTCLTTRAVHIELVASLSTDSAIMALRRMAARRGWPSIMYSDNATNFKGADNELRAAYEEWGPSLREEGQLHRMEWRYIPPGAPNQGGAWERLVRSIKTSLSTTLREKVPSEEVLLTLLIEAEFSVNARPLTHVSVDPRDPEALTPNHFLLGSSTGLPLTGPCSEADRRAWRASQALADCFWQRWVREYLPTLVPRGAPRTDVRPLRIGDIVVIVDGALPRNVWPMGVIEKVFEGPDGGIRMADIQTKTGRLRRPTSKIVVVSSEEEEASRAAPGGGC